MRMLGGVLAMALVLILGAGAVFAAGPLAVKMEVQGGFDGYYKIGEWVPFAVTLSNDGPDVEGKVWLEVPDETGAKNTFARPVSLPSRSKKKVYLYAYTTGFVRDVEVNFQAGDEIVASTKATLRPVQGIDNFLIGVISSDPSAGGVLSGLRMPSLQAQGGKRTTLARFPLSQIPPRAQSLRSLDALVFSDVSTVEIELEQRQALENWVSSGGVLIISGGASGQKTVAGLRSLFPFRVNEMSSLDIVTGLDELAGGSLKGSGASPVSLVVGADDKSTLARQDGVPLVVQQKFGLGKVVFFALDISTPPLNLFVEDGLLWRRVLAVDASNDLSAGLSKRTSIAANLQSALSNIPAMDLPSVASLAVFLLVYIVTIGPVNYLVLRRFDRREWAWLTIPVLTLLFTALAYAIGFGTKGGDVIVHEISVLRGRYGSSTAEVDTYVGIFSPARKTYQLEVGGELLMSKLQYPGPSGLGSGIEILQGEPGLIKDVNVNAWAMQSFMAEGFVGLGSSGVGSELQIEGDRVKGRITNSTGVTLEDAAVLNGQRVAKIGTVKAGESRQIEAVFESNNLVPWRPTIGMLVVGETQPMPGGTNREEMLKRQIVDAAFGYYGKQSVGWPSGGGGLTLLGWQSSSPVKIDLKGQRVVRQSTVLFMTPLPVSFGTGTVSVPPGFTTKSFVDVSAVKVAATPFGLTFGDVGSVGIRFQLPQEAVGLVPSEMSLHVDQAPSGPRPPGAAVSQLGLRLFDWKRKAWVELGKVSSGTTPIFQPERFVSSSGTIEAKLDLAGGYTEIGQLDFSLKGSR